MRGLLWTRSKHRLLLVLNHRVPHPIYPLFSQGYRPAWQALITRQPLTDDHHVMWKCQCLSGGDSKSFEINSLFCFHFTFIIETLIGLAFEGLISTCWTCGKIPVMNFFFHMAYGCSAPDRWDVGFYSWLNYVALWSEIYRHVTRLRGFRCLLWLNSVIADEILFR